MGAEPTVFLLGTLERGGSETKFVRLAGRLARAGREVWVAWIRSPDTLLDELHPSVGRLPLECSRSVSVAALRRLRSLVSDVRPGTILAVNFFPMIYGYGANIGRRRTRLLASINTTDIRGTREARFMRLYAPLMRRMDALVFGSLRQREQWADRYGLARDAAQVIHNGVDSHVFHAPDPEARGRARAALGVDGEETVFVCVAQLRPEKAHADLLRALADSAVPPDSRLVCVGDGPHRAELERTASDLGIQNRVRFVGAQPDVRPWLHAADVFVLASTAVETFSNAALEAASTGLPVIMTDIGGAAELAGEAGAPWLVPPANVAALAAAMGRLAGDAGLRRSAGRAIQDRVHERFTVASMDDAWCRVLWPAGESAEVHAS